MTRSLASVVLGSVGLALLVTVPLADFSLRFFTTWCLYLHGVVFTGVGLRALAPIVGRDCWTCARVTFEWLSSDYPYVFVDGGATLAFAVAVTIVVVLEEKHDYIFGETNSCARVFSGHFATHFAPFFLYALFYADGVRANGCSKSRNSPVAHAVLLTSCVTNFLFLYTLFYDPGVVYGLSNMEKFYTALGFTTSAGLIAAILA